MSNIIGEVHNGVKKWIQDEVDSSMRDNFIKSLTTMGLSNDKVSEINNILDDLDIAMAHAAYKKYYENGVSE